jgi:hypothetical protein
MNSALGLYLGVGHRSSEDVNCGILGGVREYQRFEATWYFYPEYGGDVSTKRWYRHVTFNNSEER